MQSERSNRKEANSQGQSQPIGQFSLHALSFRQYSHSPQFKEKKKTYAQARTRSAFELPKNQD